MYGFKSAVAIGCAGIIAQIYIIVLRQARCYRLENRKATVAGIENTYWMGCLHVAANIEKSRAKAALSSIILP